MDGLSHWLRCQDVAVPPPSATQALCDALEAVQYEGHGQVSERAIR